MRLGPGPVLVATLLALTPLAPRAYAQGLRLNPVHGELAVGFDGLWAQFPAGPYQSRRTLREWLVLGLDGYVSDPRVVRFDLTLRPLFGQRAWSGIGESPNGQIRSLNGYGRMILFGNAPVSFTAWWSRLFDDQDLAFGSHQETDATNWELMLNTRWRPLPTSLTYTDLSLQQFFRANPGFISPLDERRRLLRLSAANSKLRVDLERLDFMSRSSNLDFIRSVADIDHTFRWGRGSRLSSGFLYLNRTGRAQLERIDWRQTARLFHAKGVTSTLGYRLHDATLTSDFNRGWAAHYIASINGRNRPKITVGGEYRDRSFRLGEQRYARAQARLGGKISLPYQFSLGLSGSAGYEWYEQNLSEANGFGTVVDERHVVDATGSFTLNEPLADPATVIITSEDGTLVFVDGVDYRLVESPPRLEVFTLPGGRMTDGTAVLVDYRIRLLVEGEDNLWTYGYDIELRRGSFSAYHRRAERNRVENGAPVLNPTFRQFSDMAVGARMSGATPFGFLTLGADYARRTRFLVGPSNQVQVRGGWRYLFGPRLNTRLTARYTSRTNSRRFVIFEGTGGIEWLATSRLRLRMRLSAYDWRERALRSERFFGAGVGAEWHVRKLSVRLSYDRNAWTEGFEHTEDQVVAQVTRSF